MPSLAGADVRARYLAATLDAALSKLNSNEDSALVRVMIANARRSALRLADTLAPEDEGSPPTAHDAPVCNVVPFPRRAAGSRACP